MSYVPVLDFCRDPAALARDIDDICREVGFFQFVEHGVTDRSDAAWDAMRRFFDMPLEQRMSVRSPSLEYPHGYSPLAGEALGRSLGADAPPDLKEVFNSGPVDQPPHEITDEDEWVVWSPNLWPTSLPELQQTWTSYHRAMQALANRLMQLFALALSLPETYFDSYIDHAACGLRGICYPARSVPPEPGQLRAGAHTDYGTLTLLRQDNVGGLEVTTRGGEWVGVESIPDAFVVNIGDLMAGWTNDRWRSTLHRVTDPPVAADGAFERRFSMPFFHNANWDARVSCLPTCLPPGELPKYPPVIAGPHLRAKFQRSVETV
ncbi:MAG: isopenicillin N synthase family dioxygenase [Sciscionella sp.]